MREYGREYEKTQKYLHRAYAVLMREVRTGSAGGAARAWERYEETLALDLREVKGAHSRGCSMCGKSGFSITLLSCAGCSIMQYCSTACQKSHWRRGHKKPCTAFSSSA